MASEKRKAVVADGPVKRYKNDFKGDRKPSQKFGKSEEHNERKSAKPEKEDTQERMPVKSTLLQAEERAFPRGGASVLTPLEHKQIRLEAERDVLFEQSGKQKPKSGDFSDEEDEDATEGAAPAPKKRRKSAPHKSDTPADVAGNQIRVQGLSYKNLVVGSMVLGRVTGITSRDVALALPNNLTGFVPLMAISEKLNSRIEALLQDDEAEKVDEDEEDEDVELKSLFHVGQYLRARVTSTTDESTVNGLRKSKRKIELTLDPQQTNEGLRGSDLAVNNMVQASVRSVEDHGLVMDLGFEKDSVRGFISKKELGRDWELSRVQEGQVFLCSVTGLASDGKVAKLCPDASKMGDASKHHLSNAPTVDAFLPGTAVEVLVTETARGGVAGKIMGMLDATADNVHSGAGGRSEDASKQYKIGEKVTARVICTFPNSEDKKVGVSFLDHVKQMKDDSSTASKILEPSSIVEEAKVFQVEPAMGLFLDVGVPGYPGYAHISKISDKKIDTLFETSGQYKIGSTHRARVLGFNPVDRVYALSLEPKVLEQPFLRIEDVKVGQDVKGTVEKLILGKNDSGIVGVLVTLADGVSGLIPEMHLADVHLSHPEKKFREGFPVKARVLSVDLDKRQIRLTMKKTLLNSDAGIWDSYEKIAVGGESPGTIINIKPNGAVVQFYGPIRAWLPIAEMSEAYISDASKHFRIGQTVMVHAISVDSTAHELKVSCKDSRVSGENQTKVWDAIIVGQLATATVTEAAGDNVMLELEDSGIKASLPVSHLTDGSEQKSRSTLKQIRVGQKLSDVLVLEKREKRQIITLSNKPSLVKASKGKTLITTFKDAREGREVAGFVRNITPDGVFVEFAGAVVGFLPKTQITQDKLALPAFGLRKDQSISATILSVDKGQSRFVLTLREIKKPEAQPAVKAPIVDEAVVNPLDETSTSVSDYSLGKQTQARIVSIKDTQLNVQLADNLQGRIDVSEVFDSWEDIKDRKRPLQKFKPKDVLPVKILGVHDARNHRFLPITHRQSRIPVFELTAKANSQLDSDADILNLDKVAVGSSWIAFVNNIDHKCLWVNLSPNVRGRIDLMDVSDDVSLLQDLHKNFPVGSAIRVRVKHVDVSSNRLDLTAASHSDKSPVVLKDLSVGMILPAKVNKVTDRALIVTLNEDLTGAVPLTELADDFTEANTKTFKRNDVLRVCVVDVDMSNKRVYLSLRPSKILSSALPVKDKSLTSITQLAVSDVVRGFVKMVRDNGLIVTLGSRVEAFVRVSDLSDAFIKDWKSSFEVDQLVEGKILAVDAALNHVQMSLKASHVDKDYVPPTSFTTLKQGQIITGKVRKVEEFGVFIDVDNTQPRVSGLCHRSQIADNKVVDAKTLFEEGDAVKAKILSIDTEKKRISFGLKASYFKDEASDDEMDDDEEGVQLDGDEEMASDEDSEGGVDLSNVKNLASDVEDDDAASDMSVDEEAAPKPTNGLRTSGFDWTGDSVGTNATTAASDSETEATVPKKRKRKAAIQVDHTGDLDANGPQSSADFERLLLSSPNSADLWVQYMAFQLRLSEISAARNIGERALRTIHIRETDEKLAIWIALLNLSVSYGDDDEIERTFRDACAVQDPFVVHERMAEIYTAAGKPDKADKVFEAMVGTKAFRASPAMWLNYASFLFDKLNEPARARALLPRAMQSLHASEHRLLTAKFAGLEFKSENGDAERGRTIFEGLVAEWPKWTQGWDMWIDLEKMRIMTEGDDAKEKVRGLFERIAKLKMKKRRARFVFKKWLEFEEAQGDGKMVDRVKAVAKAYVDGMKGGDDDGEE